MFAASVAVRVAFVCLWYVRDRKKQMMMLVTAKLVTFVFPFPVKYSFFCVVIHDLVTITVVCKFFPGGGTEIIFDVKNVKKNVEYCFIGK